MVFHIKPADNFIWNQSELIDFLIAHQSKSITITTSTEGCCARTVGLYDLLDKFDFASVLIKTSNPLEHHNKYKIQIIHPWKFFKVVNAIDAQWHTWNQKSVFGTLFGRPLWHRLGIAAHLLYQHRDISAVGLVANPTDQNTRELFELTQLWQHSPVSFKNFAKVADQLPIFHSNVSDYVPGASLTDGYVAQTYQTYRNFLVDIVAETFTSGNCFFVTEKTIRPILMKKPFIVMGPTNFLDYLHQMGFRTFSDFWDETYDGYCEADRFSMILQLIDTLAKKSLNDLEKLYWQMQYTLEHNYNLLIEQKYKTNIDALV